MIRIFWIKNQISKLLNPLSVLVYPHFRLLISSCQIYQNLPFLSLSLSLYIYIYIYIAVGIAQGKRSPYAIMTNMVGCNIVINEFKVEPLGSLLDLWEKYEPTYTPNYGLIVLLLFFYKNDFGIKETTKINMSLNKETKLNHSPRV